MVSPREIRHEDTMSPSMVVPKDIILEEGVDHEPYRVLSNEVKHEDAMSHIWCHQKRSDMNGKKPWSCIPMSLI